MTHDNKGKQPFHAYHDPSPAAYSAPATHTQSLENQPESRSHGGSLANRIAQSASSLVRSVVAGPSSGGVHGNELVSSLAGLGSEKANASSSTSIATSSQHDNVGRHEVKHGVSGAEGFRSQSSMQHHITPEEVQTMLDSYDPSSHDIAPFTKLDVCNMGVYRSSRTAPPSSESQRGMLQLSGTTSRMDDAWQNATSQHDINMTSEWDFDAWHHTLRHEKPEEPANDAPSSHHNIITPSHDISIFSSHDGDDVLAILNDPSTFTSPDDLTTSLTDTATTSVDDLFPDASLPLAPFSAHPNDAHDFAATTRTAPPSSTLVSTSRTTNTSATNSDLDRLTMPGADLADPTAWLHDWERALTHYADDVWDPASFPWVQEAREAIGQAVRAEEQKRGSGVVDNAGDEAREKALRRLRMLVGHIKIGGGGSEGGNEITKMSMYAIPGAR